MAINTNIYSNTILLHHFQQKATPAAIEPAPTATIPPKHATQTGGVKAHGVPQSLRIAPIIAAPAPVKIAKHFASKPLVLPTKTLSSVAFSSDFMLSRTSSFERYLAVVKLLDTNAPFSYTLLLKYPLSLITSFSI
ncbi:hypothetical protein ABG808_08845 [Streptococcus iniae]